MAKKQTHSKGGAKFSLEKMYVGHGAEEKFGPLTHGKAHGHGAKAHGHMNPFKAKGPGAKKPKK